MTLNQLFKKKPTLELVLQILSLLKINSVDDFKIRSFSKNDITPTVLEKMEEMKPLNFEKSLLGHSGPLTDLPKGVSLKGSIDEFVLFEVAYDDDSIRRIYEIGRPFAPSDRLGPSLP